MRVTLITAKLTQKIVKFLIFSLKKTELCTLPRGSKIYLRHHKEILDGYSRTLSTVVHLFHLSHYL